MRVHHFPPRDKPHIYKKKTTGGWMVVGIRSSRITRWPCRSLRMAFNIAKELA